MVDLFDQTSHTWQERLAYVLETMREMSLQTNPHDMVAAYSARMAWFNTGRVLSLSRRGVDPPQFVLARDSEWENQPNPWQERDQLPVMEGGLLGELIYGNDVRYIEALAVPDDDPGADLLRGYESLAALPVFDGGEARNMVIVLRKEPRAFDPENLPQMVWMTNLFGRATHNLVLSDEVKRAYSMLDQEMQLIAEIQRSLLPPALPEIPNLDLASYYRPATRAGGDYYDFFPLEDGRWGMMIADVSGHGSPAAVEMAITRTLAHVETGHVCCPAEMLTAVNQHMVRRGIAARGAFVTAFYGVFDPAARTVEYASAGHHPPRLKRCSDGSLFSLEAPGAPPLGIVASPGYRDASRELVAGDQMILYTDGLTEAFNVDGEMFGAERLDGTLEHCGVDANALIETVLGELERFTSGRELEDDVTLLVARVT